MKFFVLFACCIPTRGAKRSIIADTQRSKFRLIPNELYDILLISRTQTISEIKAKFPKKHHKTIDEYFEVLIEEEYGFYTDTPERFPEISLDYFHPGEISNAIIDIDQKLHDFDAIFRQLETLGCRDIQIRSFSFLSLSKLDDILLTLGNSTIKSLEILMPYHQQTPDIEYLKFCEKHARILLLILHSADADDMVTDGFYSKTHIIKTKAIIDSEKCCGIISPHYFTFNIRSIAEGANFNSCLHQKISIDKDGYIKNCPSISHSYGSIENTKLQEVVRGNNRFRKFGSIKKDQISICSDCEFRMICTDCRAYLKEESLYSKPLKCSYDPYEMEWK